MTILLAACSSPENLSVRTSKPSAPPVDGETPTADGPRRVTGLSIVSVVGSASGATGSAWTVSSQTRSFDVRIVLQGTGTVTVRVRLRRDGFDVHDDTQVHELEGERLELVFQGVGELSAPGEYALVVEASGPGARQRSEVRVRRR